MTLHGTSRWVLRWDYPEQLRSGRLQSRRTRPTRRRQSTAGLDGSFSSYESLAELPSRTRSRTSYQQRRSPRRRPCLRPDGGRDEAAGVPPDAPPSGEDAAPPTLPRRAGRRQRSFPRSASWTRSLQAPRPSGAGRRQKAERWRDAAFS